MCKKIKIFPFFSFIALSLAFTSSNGPIHVESTLFQKQRKIKIQFFLDRDYGIQKKSLHKINLYRLSPMHVKVKKVSEKIKRYGKLLQTKNTLEGASSRKDKNYFSSVEDIYFKIPYKDRSSYAVSGKLFYCSFVQGLCSTYKFESPVLSSR